jgi:hypothetical protein
VGRGLVHVRFHTLDVRCIELNRERHIVVVPLTMIGRYFGLSECPGSFSLWQRKRTRCAVGVFMFSLLSISVSRHVQLLASIVQIEAFNTFESNFPARNLVILHRLWLARCPMFQAPLLPLLQAVGNHPLSHLVGLTNRSLF